MSRGVRFAIGVGIASAILWFGPVLAGDEATNPQAADRVQGESTALSPTAGTTKTVISVSASPLADTQWRLVEFQSMDDAQGTTRPSDPSLYTMHLKSDGTVTMRLNCNRAMGTWSAKPGVDAASGRFEFGPLAMTRALCPPPSMDESIAAQAQFIRSYLLKDGRLYLSLMADGGIYAWEPDTDASSTAVSGTTAQATSDRWQAAREESSKAWESAKKASASAWDAAKADSAEAWQNAKEQSASLWAKATDEDTWREANERSQELWVEAKEKSHDAWVKAQETSHSAWVGASEISRREWEKAKAYVSGSNEGPKASAEQKRETTK